MKCINCGHVTNTCAFLQPRHHDDGSRVLFPHHLPEVGDSIRQRSLCCNVCVLLAVTIHEVGVDVVSTLVSFQILQHNS